MREHSLRFALLALGLAAGLAGAEILVRIFLPQQLVEYRPDLWLPDETGLGHRHAANLDTLISTGEREVRVRTDARGHRVGDGAIVAELRLLAVGDSFLEALAVPYEQTMTARLERGLGDARGVGVRVVNTGVSGYGPNNYRVVVEQELRRASYRAVLVFLYVINDVSRGRIDPIPPRTPASVHAFELPRSLERGALRRALVKPLYDRLRSYSHLFVLLKARGLAFLLGVDKSHFPSHLLTDHVDAPEWRVTGGLLAEIARKAERAGVPILFVLIPSQFQVYPEPLERYARSFEIPAQRIDADQPNRLLERELRRRGLEVVDVLPALRAAAGSGLAPYGIVDRHLSPEGHRVVAETLQPTVDALLDDPSS